MHQNRHSNVTMSAKQVTQSEEASCASGFISEVVAWERAQGKMAIATYFSPDTYVDPLTSTVRDIHAEAERRHLGLVELILSDAPW